MRYDMIDTFWKSSQVYVVYLTICLDPYIPGGFINGGGGLIWIVSLDSVSQAYRLQKYATAQGS